MDANFFYTIYVRLIQRQPYACVHLLTFSLKNFSETIDWIVTKFHSSVLR